MSNILRIIKNTLPVIAAMLFSGNILWAQVKLPAIIGDNMVLQQQSEVAVWGWAQPGQAVLITPSWSNKQVKAIADNGGKWMVQIKTAKAGGPYKIDFEAGGTKQTVSNVLLGEVWLASGQSNMEFTLGKGESSWRTGVIDYEHEVAKADYPQIRMIDVENKVADTEQADFNGKWQVCTPQTANDFSAVAYYFSLSVQKETGYPVGIINATWGGTPAQSWTKKSILEQDPDFQQILKRYDTLCAKYPEAYEQYKEKLEKWKADTGLTKKGAPKEPVGPGYNKSPYKLYNGMIAPIIPYTLKGVIWYQGESNADYAYQYRRLFPAMIGGWRKDWNNKALPFYFVQIAPHKGQNPVIRESQLLTYLHTKNTGMAVTTDVGDSADIHPRNKKTVGERLALWALDHEYGKKVITSGPVYRSMKITGNKIELSFDFNKGLHWKNKEAQEFVVAGSDHKFYPARAIIQGDKVVIWSNEVTKPEAVRYGWLNVPHAELYNEAELPASPFRTDTWEVETQGKN